MRIPSGLQWAVALAAAFAASGAVVLLAGRNPLGVYRALFEGALGSTAGLAEVGVKGCPLLLCALGIAVAFRTGVWNIGAEGQFLFGALAAAWVAPHLTAVPPLPGAGVVLAAAAAAGAGSAGVAALLKQHRGVSEVISTIMLNFIALGVVSYLVQGPLMEAGGSYPQTDPVPEALRLRRLLPPTRLHSGVALALVAAVGVGFLLLRTRFGFAAKAVGANPRAAALAGFPVARIRTAALVLSGALAGFAGGVELSAVTYRLYERFSPGYGFTAIAVALLGRLHPAGVAAAAIFFAVLEAGSDTMQRTAGIPSVLVSVVQGTVILVLVGLERREWLARGMAQ